MNQFKKLYLASASPRRREILELAGLEFEVIKVDCDENIAPIEPGEYVMELSRRKAQAGYRRLQEAGLASMPEEKAVVIGADTIVFFEDQILGKPKDEEEAFAMLRRLSGNTHKVYTGVTAICLNHAGHHITLRNGEIQGDCLLPLVNEIPPTDTISTFYEMTEVTFYDMSDQEIRDYIRTGEPMDKAGAYGIQGIGCFLVKGIRGDYFNVMGLPISHLIQVLKGKMHE